MPDDWVDKQIAGLGLAPRTPGRGVLGPWVTAGEASRLHLHQVAGHRVDNGGVITGVFDYLEGTVAARHGEPVKVAQVAGLDVPPPPDPYAGVWEDGTPVLVRGGPHVMRRGTVAGRGERPGEILVAEAGSGEPLSVPARWLRRDFNPRQARDPHSGKWIEAGAGLAGFLHGKQVVGKHINGTSVHGTYAGKGYVRPAGGGPPIKVTHVRPEDAPQARERRLPLGEGPVKSSPSGTVTDYGDAEAPPLLAGSADVGHYLAKADGHPRQVTPRDRRKHGLGALGAKIKKAYTGGPPNATELAAFPEKYAWRTAETATASTVHEPVGKPGGPGLWHHKTWQLPAYIQHVANDLRESGHDESRAIAMAVGIVKNWAAGHDGKGNAVHPDVHAAAVKAIAEWEALKARTAHGAHRTESRSEAGMADFDADGLDGSWDDPDDLPDLTGLTEDDLNAAAEEDPEQFGGWLGGDQVQRLAKLGSGARFAALKAKLAGKGIRDPGALAAHIGRKKFGKARFHALASAARKRKAGPAMAARTAELFRYWPLEECRILTRRDGTEFESGRVVEAYAAVYDQDAEIKDHEGHYIENIDPGAFSQILRSIHPDRNGGFWNATCLYNHAMTVHGTPAERFSLPCGLPRHISSEGHGLLTRTEYANTPLGEEILELVNLGALRSQSFTGGIIRSTPPLRGPGDRYGRVGGQLQRVRRLQLGLREYGLTPFAAYSGAEVLGVRMQLPGSLEEGEFEEIEDAETPGEEMFAGGHGGPPEDGSASGPSTGNRLYRLRTQEALERAGIVLPQDAAGEE